MLQIRTIEPNTLGLLKILMAMPNLQHFHLAGGTALALQIGHRFSIDLDLFTTEPFDKNELLEDLKANNLQITVESESRTIFITKINGIKVDFVKVPYPTLFPKIEIDGVRMLDIRDIAPMKLSAVAQRGTKKDFYDIFFLMKKIPLSEMLDLYLRKFQQHTVFHVIKSLSYFDDAELHLDPIVFDKKVTWTKVKKVIEKAVDSLVE